MPPAAPSASRLPGELEPLGRLTLVAVVGLGVAATVAMNDAPLAAPENVGIVLLGASFLGLMVAAGERLDTLEGFRRAGYFALQLAVAAGMFGLQARLDSFGMAWILLLPLLVQAMFVYGRVGVTVMSALVLLLTTLHVYRLGGVGAAVEAAFGVGAGIVFVLLFSAATLRESRARRDSERLGADLGAANQRLAELAANAEELATSRERNRVAREIHDSVGHSLTVAHVQIEAAAALLERDPEHSRRALSQAAEAVRQGLAELRRSVAALRSGPLDRRSLDAGLRDLCAEARAGGLDGELHVVGARRSLPAEVSLTLFRVAQEGLTNVRKHAAARRVDVVLEYQPEYVAVTVSDDGCGPRGHGAGFGLLGLEERLALLGGALTSRAREPAGFELRAEVSL
jgi:signal transduction histidine kinase